MKLNPALLAIAAAGVAAFVLLRPRPAAARAPEKGFLDRVKTLGDFVTDSIEYAAWGDLSAVVDEKGRRYATVPIPSEVRAAIAADWAGVDWFTRELRLAQPGAAVTVLGEPY